MSSGRQAAAQRMLQLADEIIALVRSWPERLQVPGDASSEPVKPSLRHIDDERLEAFHRLDAKISAAASRAGVPLLKRQLGLRPNRYPVGHTELILFGQLAYDTDEWERRILTLKHAAQEIVEIESPPKSRAKSAGEAFIEAVGPGYQMPPETKARLQAFSEKMANYPIEQFAPEALIRRIRAESEASSPHQSDRTDPPRRSSKKRAGRRPNPERDEQILSAIESGEYSNLKAVGFAFGGLTRSAVSKAAKRARDRREKC